MIKGRGLQPSQGPLTLAGAPDSLFVFEDQGFVVRVEGRFYADSARQHFIVRAVRVDDGTGIELYTVEVIRPAERERRDLAVSFRVGFRY